MSSDNEPKVETMICRACGKEFQPKRRGRKNTGFCCSRCRDKWRRENKLKDLPGKYSKTCEHCGIVFQTNNTGQKYCSVECSRTARKTGRTIYDMECLYCGTPFQTINKNRKYCSPACAAKHAGDLRRGEYYCEYCGKPRWSDHPNRNRFCSRECVNKAKHLEALSRKEAWSKQREESMTRTCANCGVVFRAKHENHRFCSAECQYESALREHHERNVARFIPVLSVCPHCGNLFSTTFRSQAKQYCSERCAERASEKRQKVKRKEQMQQAFVEPVGLKTTYRNYGGVCAICGLPVPKTTESENQWAATVDHIIPLSQGGMHSKSNCQLAHRLCNSIKLDTTDDFRIDWAQKLKDEPGRWNEQLDDLWSQLGCSDQSVM